MAMTERFILALVMVVLTACASTQQANTVVTSGFLDDYSILQKGGGDHEALQRYVNPIADWKSYTKVMIDPVQMWVGQGSSVRDLPPDERIRLTSVLFGKIRDALLGHYRIVREPGPRVMRISVALTEATTTSTVLEEVSSVFPTRRVVEFGAKPMATETATYVGAASVEAKITDAETGTLLAAAVDRRGETTLLGVTFEWNDAEKSFQLWASVLRYRLCQWRGERSCVKPKA